MSSPTMCGSSNTRTILLLLILVLAVVIAITYVHNREKKSDANTIYSPPSQSHHDGPFPSPCSAATLPLPLVEPVSWVPDLVVAKDGSGNFTTVSEAVEGVPKHSSKRFVIRIKSGVYYENVKIVKEKINIVMIGDGISLTILTSDRCADEGWRTSYTATLVVMGDGFMAQDMTVQNTAGPNGAQAVALRSESDKSAFYRCDIIGYQDTLYAKRSRQFYRECNIYGTVDFIFGHATALFQNCNLYARKPLPSQTITFTAQGRNSTDVDNGFSIHNCTLTATSELKLAQPTVRSYLGRPWKEFSRTVVMQSFLDDIIDPVGWLAWNESYSGTAEYEEFDNRGPGAATIGRVRWSGYRVMNDPNEARKFTVSEFIDGDQWLPAMKVPYVGGLM